MSRHIKTPKEAQSDAVSVSVNNSVEDQKLVLFKNKINFPKGPATLKPLTLEEKKQLFQDIFNHQESGGGEEIRTNFRFKWQTPLGLTLSGIGFGYLVNERLETPNSLLNRVIKDRTGFDFSRKEGGVDKDQKPRPIILKMRMNMKIIKGM